MNSASVRECNAFVRLVNVISVFPLDNNGANN